MIAERNLFESNGQMKMLVICCHHGVLILKKQKMKRYFEHQGNESSFLICIELVVGYSHIPIFTTPTGHVTGREPGENRWTSCYCAGPLGMTQ